MAVTNQTLNAVSSKLDEVAKVVEAHAAHVQNIQQVVLPTIDATYAPLAIVEQLRLHSDTLEAQMQSLMEIVLIQRNMDHAKSIPIHTPVDDPLQSPQRIIDWSRLRCLWKSIP